MKLFVDQQVRIKIGVIDADKKPVIDPKTGEQKFVPVPAKVIGFYRDPDTGFTLAECKYPSGSVTVASRDQILVLEKLNVTEAEM